MLGIVLDGLGWGDDGTVWGGEFLLADYRGFKRLGAFKPVAMLGGAQAAREPWRNLYAHLIAEMGWAEFQCISPTSSSMPTLLAGRARRSTQWRAPDELNSAKGFILWKAVRRRGRGPEHLPGAPG